MNTAEALEVMDLAWPRSNKIACPRHEDDTPSLHLYEEDFFCFSCGHSGDAYGLIATLSGRPIGQVLAEYRPGNRPRAEVMATVSAPALEREFRRAWHDATRRIYDAYHEVYQWEDAEVLIAALDRLGERLEDLKNRIDRAGMYNDRDPLPLVEARKALTALEEDEKVGLARDARRLMRRPDEYLTWWLPAWEQWNRQKGRLSNAESRVLRGAPRDGAPT
jgi:hypothetical protein